MWSLRCRALAGLGSALPREGAAGEGPSGFWLHQWPVWRASRRARSTGGPSAPQRVPRRPPGWSACHEPRAGLGWPRER
eukprot:13934421-Alexandrium_andersonii.AAC.1